MTKLFITRLPYEITGEDVILRHWLTLDDGSLWFQDEEIQRDGSNKIESRRTDWEQLPTPPCIPPVVGLIDFGGMPLAMRADGSTWIWGRELIDGVATSPLEHWIPFLEKVPHAQQKGPVQDTEGRS